MEELFLELPHNRAETGDSGTDPQETIRATIEGHAAADRLSGRARGVGASDRGGGGADALAPGRAAGDVVRVPRRDRGPARGASRRPRRRAAWRHVAPGRRL